MSAGPLWGSGFQGNDRGHICLPWLNHEKPLGQSRCLYFDELREALGSGFMYMG